MTDDRLELSRRRILAGLSTVGVASAGAGMGTSAFFSDEEGFENNQLTAGELDLVVDYATSVDQGAASPSGTTVTSGRLNGSQTTKAYSYNIADVKPGDSGVLEFCIKSDNNPAYVWLCGELRDNKEVSVTEPEAEADAEDNNTVASASELNESANDNFGELAQSIQATLTYDTGNSTAGADLASNTTSSGSNDFTILSGTLDTVLSALSNGIPLDGDGQSPTAGTLVAGDQDCFAGSRELSGDGFASPCLRLEWEVPTSVGNEIQSDAAAFDLRFSAQQCRHTDGTQNLCGDGGSGGGSGDDDGTGGGGGSQKPGISFIAFCADSDIQAGDIGSFSIEETNDEDEPIKVSWKSTVDVDNIAVKTGGGQLAIENFDGGDEGTVEVGTGDNRKQNQTPSHPCPDATNAVKFEYDDDNWNAESD